MRYLPVLKPLITNNEPEFFQTIPLCFGGGLVVGVFISDCCGLLGLRKSMSFKTFTSNWSCGDYFLRIELLWAKAGKYLFFVLIVYVATAILYYYGTSEGKALRFFSAGALLTTILIILTSYLFGVYINNFSNYNELYGSIGALLILLFYLWLNANILLLGYELNASLTLLKKRQTTT